MDQQQTQILAATATFYVLVDIVVFALDRAWAVALLLATVAGSIYTSVVLRTTSEQMLVFQGVALRAVLAAEHQQQQQQQQQQTLWTGGLCMIVSLAAFAFLRFKPQDSRLADTILLVSVLVLPAPSIDWDLGVRAALAVGLWGLTHLHERYTSGAEVFSEPHRALAFHWLAYTEKICAVVGAILFVPYIINAQRANTTSVPVPVPVAIELNLVDVADNDNGNIIHNNNKNNHTIFYFQSSGSSLKGSFAWMSFVRSMSCCETTIDTERVASMAPLCISSSLRMHVASAVIAATVFSRLSMTPDSTAIFCVVWSVYLPTYVKRSAVRASSRRPSISTHVVFSTVHILKPAGSWAARYAKTSASRMRATSM